MLEIWKIHPEYTKYEFSNLGNARRIGRNKNLHQFISHKGYKVVYAYKNGKKYGRGVHRFMMETFYPQHALSQQVNHIDGNKLNNTLENLEWVSPSENVIHGFINGLMSTNKKVYMYDIYTGEYKGEYLSSLQAAKALNLTSSKIRETCRGVRARCGDYFASRNYLEELPVIYRKLKESK